MGGPPSSGVDILIEDDEQLSQVEILIWATSLVLTRSLYLFSDFSWQALILFAEHMGPEHASREKKMTMVNFLILVQKNVSTIRFQEIKIRPFQDFEKMRFLCFYIIKSMARKGYFGPKSDFRGSKIPPRGASST